MIPVTSQSPVMALPLQEISELTLRLQEQTVTRDGLQLQIDGLAEEERERGLEAERAVAAHRSTLEAVEQSRRLAAVAERAHAMAVAEERTANERLAAEQRRLTEALAIRSALSEHLREVSLNKPYIMTKLVCIACSILRYNIFWG